MSVRIACTSIFIFMFIAGTAVAQNALPVITNVQLVADAAKKTVTVTYNLSDADNARVKVGLLLSNDGGNTFTVKPREIKGDVGAAVAVGKSKKITLAYNAADISEPSKLKIKLIADDLAAVDMKELMQQVDTVALRKNVEFIFGERNHKTENGRKRLTEIANTITDYFKQLNMDAMLQDSVIEDINLKNVVGQKKGLYNNDDIYIVCAHYDAVKQSWGADDNASGVAGVMEAARILSKYNFKSSVRFIAFDLEEAGAYGSRLYVFDGGLKKNDKVKGVFNYDMIGYYSDEPNSQFIPNGFNQLFPGPYEKVSKDGFRGNFILIITNEQSKFLADAYEQVAANVQGLNAITLVLEGKGESTPTLTEGDHAPFWANSLPAINLGDGAGTRNKNYHTGQDLLPTINYQFMANVVKATIATIAKMAEIQHSTSVVKGLE